MARETKDRAIEAAQVARLAEETFLALAVYDVRDEFAAEYVQAEARWQVAEEAFADAVPRSGAGALLKIQSILELLVAAGASDESLEVRHLRSLATYVSNSAGTARPAVRAHLSPA